jgi:hypothetical protein
LKEDDYPIAVLKWILFVPIVFVGVLAGLSAGDSLALGVFAMFIIGSGKE